LAERTMFSIGRCGIENHFFYLFAGDVHVLEIESHTSNFVGRESGTGRLPTGVTNLHWTAIARLSAARMRGKHQCGG
jgi:hypothetical protein